MLIYAHIIILLRYFIIYICECVCVYYTIHVVENFYSCSSQSRRKWVPTGLVLHTVCMVGTLVWPDKPRPLSSHGVYFLIIIFLLIRSDNWLSIYQPKMPVTRISESILYMRTNTIWPWKTQVLRRRRRRCATPAPTRLVPADHRYYYLQYVIILHSRRWVYASIISLISLLSFRYNVRDGDDRSSDFVSYFIIWFLTKYHRHLRSVLQGCNFSVTLNHLIRIKIKPKRVVLHWLENF